MTMKNDAKLKEVLTCLFKIDMMNLVNFDQSTRESQYFWPKYWMFELKKYRGLVFDSTEY